MTEVTETAQQLQHGDVVRLLSLCEFPDEKAAPQLNCAVSGGADSLALLALACATGRPVVAHHVDHGLRATSSNDAKVVEDACDRFGADCVIIKVELDDGPNLEARARAVRIDALPTDALFGHTADDQAETMLINLIRGAGPSGMAAMTNERHPILALRRAQTHALCETLGLSPVQDETNDSPRFLRNRIRQEVIPLLDEVAKRDVVGVLARQSGVFGQEARFMDSLAEGIDATDARKLAEIHPVIAKRALRLWLAERLDAEAHPPGQECLARAMEVATGEATSCDLVGGFRLCRTNQRLRIEAP